jgi:hypothetical protein
MKVALPELYADPFREHSSIIARAPQALLGARFRFESNSHQLLRLVDSAYARLPAQRLPVTAPTLRVRLLLTAPALGRMRSAPPSLETFSAAGLLGGATGASNLVTVAPQERSALVIVSQDMLRFAYHARYELLEFAVYTLAARVMGLVSLHAACVGLGGRAVLLMGPSGSGKSTVALQCLLQRFQFVSEDSTLVVPGAMRVLGVANFLHVRSDSLKWIERARDAAAIRASPVIRRRSGVRKFEVDLRRGDHRLANAPLDLESIVFLSVRRAVRGRALLPLSRRELLARLAATQVYAAGQAHWGAFCRKACRLGAFELRRGTHPLEAVEHLRELLASRGS